MISQFLDMLMEMGLMVCVCGVGVCQSVFMLVLVFEHNQKMRVGKENQRRDVILELYWCCMELNTMEF